MTNWRVLAVGALAMMMSAPGQTPGVSAFIDPMIAGLGMSRAQISTAYLLGTLTGAAALPLVGRALDRFGPRRVMAVLGVAFGAMLALLSVATGIVGITAGFVGIRLAGQGALTLTASTAVALWWHRRRGLAMGVTGALGAAGISLAPLGLERLIASVGWQTAWLVEAVVVWLVVVPLALLGLPRRRPVPPPRTGGGADARRSWSLAQAMRTPLFWVLTAGVSITGMLTTAIAFHQISLLGELGLSPAAAAANFLPQTLAGLLATVAAGALADRMGARGLVAGSMLLLAVAMLGVRLVAPGWPAVAFGLAVGAANGSIRAVEAAAMPRSFGTGHVGAIRGFVTAMSVAGTAFGPIVLALGQQAAGSYLPAMLGLAVLPAGMVAASVLAHPPPPHPGGAATEPAAGDSGQPHAR